MKMFVRIAAICTCLFAACLSLPAQKRTLEDSLRHVLQKHTRQDTTHVKLLNDLVEEISFKNPKEAIEYTEQALALAQKLHFYRGESDSYYHLSNVYKHYRNQDKSIEYGKKGLDIDMRMRDTARIASSLNNIGNIYKAKDDNAQAMLYYYKAMRYLGNKKYTSRRSGTLNCIGTIFYNQKNFKMAMKYFDESLELSKEINDVDNMARTQSNIALIYEEEDKIDLALSLYYSALKLEESKDLFMAAALRSNIAGIYFYRNQLDSAIFQAEKSRSIRLSIGDTTGVIEIGVNIASIYATQKKFDLAIQTLQESVDYSTKGHYRSLLQTTYSDLASIYSEMGQYQQAYDYQKKSSLLKDTIFSSESTRQVADMQTRYETEKKENEINLLNKENELSESEISRQHTLLIGLGGIVVLLCIVGVIAYRAYRSKRKANMELGSKNKEIELQRNILEEKNKEITDSIHYASRIQQALITSDEYIMQHLPGHFIFYRPKDIVSGDFYWALSPEKDQFYVCTADCTGHGVPGAFMSLLNISLLSEVIVDKKITRPDLVLNEVRKDIIKALNPKGTEETQDGMDCVLCLFDFRAMTLQYAAANNAFYIVRGNEIIPCPADKMPVGKSPNERLPFTLNTIALQKGDVVYTLTDGYPDQFGGKKGKKFKYKQLEDLFLSIHHLPMEEQAGILNERFNDWKAGMEQVDDVLIIGVKV